MKTSILIFVVLFSQIGLSQSPSPSPSPIALDGNLSNSALKPPTISGNIVIGLGKDMVPVIIEAEQSTLEQTGIYETIHSFGRVDVQAGVVAFAPIEHWIKNDTDSVHPWIRVDTYRIGLGGQVGRIYGIIDSLENFNVRQMKFGLGSPYWNANLSYVKDIMVIHPSVTGPKGSFLRILKLNINVLKDFQMAVKGITEQLIDSPEFEPGDMAVSNSTISFGGTFTTQPAILAFGPGVNAGLSFARTHQISVLKLAQNQVVAHWSKIRDINLNIEAGLRATLFSLPVFGFKNEWRTEREYGYAFDMTDPTQRSSLIDNLHTSDPKFAVPPKSLDSKLITDMVRTYLFSAFGFRSWSHSILKHHEIDYGPNGTPDAELYEKVARNRKRGFWFHNVLLNDQNIVTAKILKPDPTVGGLTDLDKMNLTLQFDYDKKFATLNDYKHVYNNVITLMPDRLQAIKPDALSVQPVLGHLTFSGRIQFKSSALKEIFGRHLSDLEICKNFYDVLPVAISTRDNELWTADRWCTTFIPRLRPVQGYGYVDDRPHKPLEALEMVRRYNVEPYDKAADIAAAINETESFLEKFKAAQQAIEKARSGNKKLMKVADKIQELGSGSRLLKTRIEALQNLVVSGEVVREATLASDVGGFIGYTNAIKVSTEDQFGSPSDVEALELTKSASEVLLYKVRNYFFDLFRYSTLRLVEDISINDARP